MLRAERCAGVTNYLRGDAVARGLEVGVLQELCSAGAVAGVAVGHGEEERQQNKAHVVVELVGRQRSIAQRGVLEGSVTARVFGPLDDMRSQYQRYLPCCKVLG